MAFNLTDFLTWLDGYLNFEKTPVKNIFWLDTMRFLCKKLNNPQDSFKSIHIAGSKGKGSVAVMTASILEAGGIKCGLYTSPHITDFRERICTPHGFFSDEVYEKSALEIKDCISALKKEELPGQRNLTWFEIVTAFAFVCFKNAGCTHAVIETGLGGRLDSTNIIKSSLCIITRMEKEHCEFLGDTIEKISFEKAGIIKSETPVLVFSQEPHVEEVFRLKAEQENAQLYFSKKEGSAQVISYRNCNQNETENCKTPACTNMKILLKSLRFKRPLTAGLKMPGDFQAQNALLASLAVKLLLPDFPEQKIEEGLSSAFLPGRFELVKNPLNKNQKLILDGAHTVNSVRFTMETLCSVFKDAKKHLLFGCASDKDVEDIACFFKDEFESVKITKPGNVKSCDSERMKAAFKKAGIQFDFNENFTESIQSAIKKAAEQNVLLLVTGSFYLVSEVKKTLGTLLETPQVIS